MTIDTFARAASPTAPSKRKPTTTLTVRLTLEQRARLKSLAGDRPVSANVRSRLFGPGGARKSHGKRSTQHNVILAQVLSALGRSNIGRGLSAILWASDTGKLALDPATVANLRKACTDVAAIRQDLIAALGLNAR